MTGRLAPTGSVAVGAGYVWAAYGDSTLARIEPRTMRVAEPRRRTRSRPASSSAPATVWVANSGDATVQRFDPFTFEEGPLRPISVGGRPARSHSATERSGSRTAATTRSRASIPEHGREHDISVGDAPVGVAVGEGAVWVANAGDGTVSRIDPRRHAVAETIEVGGAPAGIAVAGGLRLGRRAGAVAYFEADCGEVERAAARSRSASRRASPSFR